MDRLREYIESALKNIRANKMRTALTMLGIIIGIAAVIAIITLGNGMAGYVSAEVNSIGSNTTDIYIDSLATSAVFTQEDADALEEEYPEILGTSFYFGANGIISGRKGAFDAGVIGVNPAYEFSSGNGLKYGRYFTRDELESSAYVCVIMANDAKKLLGTENAIGMSVEVNVGGTLRDFEIIGIRDNYGDMIMKLLELEEYPIITEIPYTTYGSAFSLDISHMTTLEVYTRPEYSSADTMRRLVRFIEVRKGLKGQNAISYYSMSDQSSEIDNMMGTITTFMTLVAAISLLVGGVGVMNIMLVSVTERTREIGIRKSIGARTSSILMQFLAESSIISLMGGMIGILLGIIIAAVACTALKFDIVITPSSVIVAVLFSTLIGIFFGIYPARKAARLRPVDALASR